MESDPNFIPRSARIDFTFHMTREAETTAEFEMLKTSTSNYILEVRQKLKEKIIEATKIEMTVLSKQLLQSFAKSLRITVEAFLISNAPTFSVHPIDDMAVELLQLHGNDLLKHLNCTTARFLSIYNEVHCINTPPAAGTSVSDHNDSLVLQGLVPGFNPTASTNDVPMVHIPLGPGPKKVQTPQQVVLVVTTTATIMF